MPNLRVQPFFKRCVSQLRLGGLADPDPERAQLLALRNLLVWYLCERARQSADTGWEHGTCIQVPPRETIQMDFGVFITYEHVST